MLIYIPIMAVGCALLSLVYINHQRAYQDALVLYRAESAASAQMVATEVQGVFKQTYQCIRTVARLPGIRALNHNTEHDLQFHGGEGIESNTLLSIQEIYNNLGSNVAVSELYVVPINLDADAPESDVHAAREPLVTFDSLIVGVHGGDDTGEEEEEIELEEIEIFEYRLMKKQLAWLKKHYPLESDINNLEYPMIGGPPVVTCDNTYYDPTTPDDGDRSGLIFSMPYYSHDGKLQGCISAIILTHALKNLLPTDNYAVTCTEYDYCVSSYHDGQRLDSLTHTCDAKDIADLLMSLSSPLDVKDKTGNWSLLLGRPDSDFLKRTDVLAAARSRNMAYAFVSTIILTAMFGAWLFLRGRQTILRINEGLEQNIRDQTSELEATVGELNYQKLAMDEHSIVSITDISGDITYANDRFCELSGYKRDELIGQNHRIVKSGEHPEEFYRDIWDAILQGKVWRGEIKNRAKDGRYYWVDATMVPFKDENGEISQCISIRTDITAIKDAQNKLRMAAEHDLLTDLPNRESFSGRLQQSIRRAEADPTFKFAVLFFDFDRFKVINDSLGHSVGDALLIDIARQFEYILRHGDTPARFGGDEFVVLLNDLKDYKEAHHTAERLLNTFAKPHTLLGHSVTSTASIGLVTNERGYNRAEDMIRDADAAMYQAKENGKAQVVEFDQKMHESALHRLTIEADLRVAVVSDDQFRLVYQPIIELGNGELTGFEALIRWDHPRQGIICPDDFIPIAEDTGLIIQIGQWVLSTAAAQIADWNQRLGQDRPLKVNVNVSKRQLLAPTFVGDVRECQREYDLPPGVFCLEITESVIADDRNDVAPLLRELRELGFPIVMDDFGTGVSSLSALHNYPLDVLKIDQAFIQSLDNDRSLLAVVASITKLAENLGIQTVAEGIETDDIVGALQSIDCTWGQGYYFAKPLSVADAEAYILGTNENKQSA
jgi:diguanylate cyclase (GGDEF)-like protein/PAS domain S-box-containing protein